VISVARGDEGSSQVDRNHAFCADGQSALLNWPGDVGIQVPHVAEELTDCGLERFEVGAGRGFSFKCIG
jgi:hypothetical protein